MKFLFLLTQDLESPSGLGRYYPFARALARCGQDVTIAALHASYATLENKHPIIDGVQIHYVAPMHVRKAASQKTYYPLFALLLVLLRATLRLSAAALQYRADVIVVGKPHPMNSIAGLLGRLFHHSLLVVDCDDYEAGSGNFQNRLQKTIVGWFERTVPRWAGMVTTNTYFLRDLLLRWRVRPEAITYLPNGYDPQRFAQPPAPAADRQIRAALGLDHPGGSGDAPVIAFIGSLSLVNHPIDLLVDAFVEIRREVPAARLLLVGGGEDFERTQTLVQRAGLAGAVVFAGRVPPAEIGAYYRLAQVSVDPVYDNDAARGRCPLKMFESWACGVPFVTAPVGDRKLLAGEPPAAAFALPGDSHSLAQAIVGLLRQPQQAQDLAARGEQRAGQFRWDRLTEEWLERLAALRAGRL